MAKKEAETGVPTAAARKARRRPGTLGPRLPARDSRGNYPALEAVTALLARDILAHRQRLGLSQAELARLAGVRPETLNRLEQGKQTPNVRTVDKIDGALRRVEARRSESDSLAAGPGAGAEGSGRPLLARELLLAAGAEREVS